MGQAIANASMSIDGYIAKHDNTIGRLFDWLQNGEVEVRTDDVPLGDPIECVQGDRVTHLVFPVEQTMTSAAEPRA